MKQSLVAGGRIAFTTIHVSPGLDDSCRRRAHRCGPRAVASRAEQPQLLRSAGFVDIEEHDVTASFIETARAWIDERTRHRAELALLEAPGAFEQRLRDSRAQLAATEAGMLRRTLLYAKRS